MKVQYGVSIYNGQKEVTRVKADVPEIGKHTFPLAVEKNGWRVDCDIRRSEENGMQVLEGNVTFEPEEGEVFGSVFLQIDLASFDKEDYLLMPAAVYGGNRFRALNVKYPPMFHTEDGIGANMETLITDVPRLNETGGTVHLRSGDMSTPAFGVWLKEERMGVLWYGTHRTSAGYTGYRFQEKNGSAAMVIQAPCVRQARYGMVNTNVPSDDQPHLFRPGNKVCLSFRLFQFPCDSVTALFAEFMNTRLCMSDIEARTYPHELSFSNAFAVIQEKYQKTQWNDTIGYWRQTPWNEVRSRPGGDWHTGWCGGGISAYALMTDGDSLSRERSARNMDNIFGVLQAPTGFIYPLMYEGCLKGDDYCNWDDPNFLLLRKDADVLYFAARTILRERKHRSVPENWITGLRRLADAFVRLFRRYGQLGQFVDIQTEQIIAGGTAGAAIAIGGLALTYVIVGDIQYLNVASALADLYYRECVCRGLLNGGPGEILQNPDSESAFGLLEGLMTLYDVTLDSRYLQLAQDCANQAASWCMSYDFAFPDGAEFNRLDMRTTGSVFANVQNKHSAPGICTLSPLSLIKLSLAAEIDSYMILARDIAHNITQYLSRQDRPIHDHNKEVMPSGWMNERVNTSDWEGANWMGEVFRGSCWCEISAMLTYNEVPGILLFRDTKRFVVFDHVTVAQTIDGYAVHNPTPYPVQVKILVLEQEGSYRPEEMENMTMISVLPKDTMIFPFA